MKQEQNISVLIYTDTKDRYEERSVLPGNTYDIPPHIAQCHDNNSYNFSDFQLYQVTLPIDPPFTLKQKLEMVYSFTFHTALYIYIYLLSLYELCHLELSK